MQISACVFACLFIGWAQGLAAAPFYTVIDLGTLGGDSAYGYGINDSGQVTGASQSPFLYSNGQMINLGGLGGEGRGINNAGQVTGDTSISDAQRAFLYSDAQLLDLGILSGPPRSSASYGFAINNVGQVTGQSNTDGPYVHAFLYSSGRMLDLGALGDGQRNSGGEGINDAGQVTGASDTGSYVHAFFYSNGIMLDLGTLGGSSSEGRAINNAGLVTGGASVLLGGEHAFLYGNGHMTDLGTMGGLETEGLGINDLGQVTGFSFTRGFRGVQVPYHAFLYSNGQMTDLNDTIDPTLGITLTSANGINAYGQIVANGTDPAGGLNRAFLLTPVTTPEPSTGALLGIPFLALLAFQWRGKSTRAVGLPGSPCGIYPQAGGLG